MVWKRKKNKITEEVKYHIFNTNFLTAKRWRTIDETPSIFKCLSITSMYFCCTIHIYCIAKGASQLLHYYWLTSLMVKTQLPLQIRIHHCLIHFYPLNCATRGNSFLYASGPPYKQRQSCLQMQTCPAIHSYAGSKRTSTICRWVKYSLSLSWTSFHL